MAFSPVRDISIKKRSFFKRYSNYLFLAPALLFIISFTLYPILYNLNLSLKDVTVHNLIGEQTYIGFDNYIQIFKDALFYKSLTNSIIFTGLSILFQFIIGFSLALFFNMKFPGRNILRSLFLLAWVLPPVISGTLFKWLFAGDYGLINFLFQYMGLIDQPIEWLANTDTSLYSVIVANIWLGIPFNMLILLAGLQSIPGEIYEAAKIDGANFLERFCYVTFPLIRPTALIVIILGVIYTFKVFDPILIMTNGGPSHSSTVLPLYAYKLAFDTYNFSLGATVASIMFVFLLIFSTIYLLFTRKEEF